MSESVRKILALSKKDAVDFFKNPTLLITSLLPLAFILFYKNLSFSDIGSEDKNLMLFNLGVVMTCCMCGLMLASTSIAEEKEKFTLRTLMLSNISGTEFLVSKLIVCFSFTMIGNILVFFIAGGEMKYFLLFLLCIGLGTVAISLLSAVIGIISRDQMNCGVLQVPVMLLFMVPTMFAGINSFCTMLSKVTPLSAMLRIYYLGTEGELFTGEGAVKLVVLGVWIVAAYVLFMLVYKKKGLDN